MEIEVVCYVKCKCSSKIQREPSVGLVQFSRDIAQPSTSLSFHSCNYGILISVLKSAGDLHSKCRRCCTCLTHMPLLNVETPQRLEVAYSRASVRARLSQKPTIKAMTHFS